MPKPGPFRPIHAKRLAVALLVILPMSCCLESAFSQRPSSSRYSLAVDEVALVNGKKLYGIVTQRNAMEGLSMIVERAWLQSTYPRFYAAQMNSALKRGIESRTQHLFRLEAWWKSRVKSEALVSFIDQEMERIEQERSVLQNEGLKNQPRFMLLRFSPAQVQNVYRQTAARHRFAGLGWKHKIKNVSTRNVKAIHRELESLKVDTESETFDLSSELATDHPQSEWQWQARVALVEYRLRSPLDFQGVGSNLIRVGDQPANPDLLNAWTAQLMGAGITGGGDVAELLNELGIAGSNESTNRWWDQAANVAESEDYAGFLVSRIVSESNSPRVTVETCFFAKVKPGQWRQVVSLEANASRNDIDPATLERIRKAPNVSQILKLAKGLGLDSTQLLDQAISQGAATEQALLKSTDRFAEFLERFTQHTDRPNLSLAHE